MKAISKEFYRAHRSLPIRYFTVNVICAVVSYLTGAYSRESTRVPAIIVSAFLWLAALFLLVDILIEPARFKRRLGRLPDNVGEEIISGFESAPALGDRRFLENYLVYFAKRRIRFLRFDELRSADLKGNRLFLSLADGKAELLPFEPSENPAVIVAALRSKNGQMKATIDGRSVNFDKKNNRNEDA